MKKTTIFITLVLAGCGLFSDRKAPGPFAITDEEKYWSFDISFHEKFLEIRSLVFSDDSVAVASLRESIEGSYSGKAYLTQAGKDVEGIVVLENDTIDLTGTVGESKEGMRWMGLSLEGYKKSEAIHGIITVELDGNDNAGDFFKISTASGKIVGGGVRFDGIMRQENQGPLRQQPVDEDCGRKISEIVHIFNSPHAGVIRVKIEKFERCMKTTFLNTDNQPFSRKGVIVSPDLTEKVGNDTVRVYDGVLDDKKIAEKPDGNDVGDRPDDYKVMGEIKYIGVSGNCANLRYYQYRKETIKIGEGPERELVNWRPDGPSPYPGVPPMPNTTEDDSVLLDIPSFPITELPFDLATLSQPQALIDYTHLYVTYVCCDNQLKGAVVWGYTVKYTILGREVRRKSTVKVPPVWKSRAQLQGLPGRDQVVANCEGN